MTHLTPTATEGKQRKATPRLLKTCLNLESVVKSPVMPTPTPTPTPAAVVVEELDDDKLWAKLLVRRIKEIKHEYMKEDFKRHVNVIALQAVRGTWQVFPANFPSPLLSMGWPGFLNSPAKHKYPPPPPSSQSRSAQGTSGEFSGWSNVGGQARVGKLRQQMPTSGNIGNMGMPMGSMHNMTQEEWDSRMGFQGMMPSMGMQ